MAACSRPQRGDLYTEHQLTSTSSRTRIPGENMLPSVNPLQSFQHPLQTMHDHDHHPGHELSTIGRPIHFTTGQFTGYTIRMEMDEVQKADLGRKYARVDRRPLDPPPVIHLRIFEVQHAGTAAERETELEYDDIQVLGLICTVDLFPVPDAFAPSQATSSRPGRAPSASIVAGPIFTSPSPPSTSSTQSFEDHQSCSSVESPSSLYQVGSSEWQNRSPQISGDIFPSQANTNNVVHHLGNFPILESTKRTQALAGTTFVQAVLVEYRGKKAVMFAFSDLAVKVEGAFVLRYRVFDLFSRSYDQNTSEAIIGAETYGGPFRVYSTKDFPGLRASTELTKNLARWGVRLNIREAERRRRKRSDLDATPPSSPTNFSCPE